MNRSLDGDKVLVQLDPVKQWQPLKDKHSQKPDESKSKKAESSQKGYSNNQAVESRDFDEVEEEEKVSEPQEASGMEKDQEFEEYISKLVADGKDQSEESDGGVHEDISWEDCDSESEQEIKKPSKERVYHLPG